jgi:hypothetical protein
MEEFLENLLYSVTFRQMDDWRRFSAAPDPPECVMRVFVNMETRLQRRYGLITLERLNEINRLRLMVTIVLEAIGGARMWRLPTNQIDDLN